MNIHALKSHLFTIVFLLVFQTINAQNINVLFLGNSYTSVNDLPGTIASLALLEGNGKTMNYEANTPGGYCYFQHVSNSTSLNLIRRGDWDFVVLQEQSQMPSIDYYRYASMYPAATQLRDSILKYNPCAEVVFYMTWGRRDGGQQCEDYGEGIYCSADFSDFDHMQDTMTRAYCEIAEQLQSRVAPAGEAWRYARQHSDIELFSGDGSHPSIHGTYLTACTFYATFWNESPIGLPHPANLTDAEASLLQKAASQTVFGNLTNWDFSPSLIADFNYHTDDQYTFQFTNATSYPRPTHCLWDFGDNNFSDEESPIHEYTESGTYTVKLIVESCQKTDSTMRELEVIVPDGTIENPTNFAIFPNPAHGQVTLSGQGWICISNIMGQLVHSQQLYGTSTISLERGIYIATFTDGMRNYSQKIVIQ